MRHVPGAMAAGWLLSIFACGPKPPASEQPPAVSTASLDNREWALVGLGEVAAPLGAGGRAATIQFDPTNRFGVSGSGRPQRSSPRYTRSWGLIFVPFFLFAAAFAPKETGFGTGVALALPILYGVCGFIFTAIACAIYNFVAGFVGGIEVELESGRATT